MFLLQKVHLNMTETLKAEYWNFSSIWGNNQSFFFFFVTKTEADFRRGG